MRSKAIYYGGDMEGMNGKKGNISKGQDDRKDGRSEAQSFIYASDVLFIDYFVDRKSL